MSNNQYNQSQRITKIQSLTSYQCHQFEVYLAWQMLCNFQFCIPGIVIYIFSIYRKSHFFLCSKNSYSALYSSIIFIFYYICKSIIFIFRYICKRNIRNRLVIYHLEKLLKKKLCHDN